MNRLRISALLAVLAAWTFIDEIIKEGYGFDYRDLVNPQITHEKVFLILLALAVAFGWRKKKN
jgi:hypothetical protein